MKQKYLLFRFRARRFKRAVALAVHADAKQLLRAMAENRSPAEAAYAANR